MDPKLSSGKGVGALTHQEAELFLLLFGHLRLLKTLESVLRSLLEIFFQGDIGVGSHFGVSAIHASLGRADVTFATPIHSRCPPLLLNVLLEEPLLKVLLPPVIPIESDCQDGENDVSDEESHEDGASPGVQAFRGDTRAGTPTLRAVAPEPLKGESHFIITQ